MAESDENAINDCYTQTEATVNDIEYDMNGVQQVFYFDDPISIDSKCLYTLDIEY